MGGLTCLRKGCEDMGVALWDGCVTQPGTMRGGCLTVMGMIRVMGEPLLRVRPTHRWVF